MLILEPRGEHATAAAKEIIRSRWTADNALVVNIRPLFGLRANAAIELSSVAPSRRLMALTSTPTDRATDWITANWPMPPAISGIPQHRRSCHVRRDLLQQLQPFGAQIVFELREAGGIATWLSQAVKTYPEPTGSAAITNTTGMERVACNMASVPALPVARTTSGLRATSSAACLRVIAASPRGPTRLNLHVLAIGPT